MAALIINKGLRERKERDKELKDKGKDKGIGKGIRDKDNKQEGIKGKRKEMHLETVSLVNP